MVEKPQVLDIYKSTNLISNLHALVTHQLNEDSLYIGEVNFNKNEVKHLKEENGQQVEHKVLRDVKSIS